jgi:hypothetical protein
MSRPLASLLLAIVISAAQASDGLVLEIPKGVFRETITAPARVEAGGGTPLAAPSTPLLGPLVQLAREGSTVRAGEVVAAFDTTPLEARMEDIRIRFQEMKLTLADLEALRDARETEGGLLVEGMKGNEALAEIDKKRLAYESRIRILQGDASLSAARRAVKSTESRSEIAGLRARKALSAAADRADNLLENLEELRAETARFEIIAESDARVSLMPVATGGEIRKAQTGDILSPGQVFGRLAGTGSLVAVIPLEESRLACVRSGLQVILRPKSRPGDAIPASLSQVLPSPVSLPGRGARPFYEAIATPLDGSPDLLPGETLEAEILLGDRPGVYAIPRDFLSQGKILLETPEGKVLSKAEPVAKTPDFHLYENIPELPANAILRARIPEPEETRW